MLSASSSSGALGAHNIFQLLSSPAGSAIKTDLSEWMERQSQVWQVTKWIQNVKSMCTKNEKNTF